MTELLHVAAVVGAVLALCTAAFRYLYRPIRKVHAAARQLLVSLDHADHGYLALSAQLHELAGSITTIAVAREAQISSLQRKVDDLVELTVEHEADILRLRHDLTDLARAG